MQAKEFYIDQLVRVGLLLLLTFFAFLLLSSMLGVFAWAFILAVALYPLFVWLNKWLGNHASFSATIIVLLSLFLVVGTLAVLVNNMVDTLIDLDHRIRAGELIMPSPPQGLEQWPLIGEPLQRMWSMTSENIGQEIKAHSSDLIRLGSYVLTKMANKSLDFLLFIVAMMLSGYLMVQGKMLMGILKKFANRVAIQRGSELINIIRATIQNVSRGVIGISLLQALLFGILLLIAKTPGAGLLSFIALLLSIVQVGLYALVVPIAIWLFISKSFLFAVIITILLTLVSLLDSFLKPLVLARGLNTPMIIIFVGLIGGLIEYGLIGIFIGPVVLAVFYDLMRHWMNYD